MHDALMPLTWARAFTTWRFAPITTGLLVLALLLYATGVLAARRNGRRWPAARTAAFTGGLAVAGAAVMGSPGVYGDGGLFWLHMIEHLMLIMLAPWLLCLGHPISLLLAATRGRARERVEALGRTWFVRLLASPITGLAVYAAILFGVHLSSFMDAMMGSPGLMALERLLYVGGGYLFFSRLLTADPPSAAVPYPFRLFGLLMGMSADTVVGIVLLQATHSPFPSWAAMRPSWGPGPVADIHDGGAAMWIGGDGLMFAMMVIVGATWMLDRSPEAARAGGFLESVRQAALADTGHVEVRDDGSREQLRTSGNVDEDDAALDAYNALLSRLNAPRRDHPS